MKALPTQNERLVLAKRPGRGSVDSETFRREVVPLPKLQDGEVLVRVDYCAIVSRRLSDIDEPLLHHVLGLRQVYR